MRDIMSCRCGEKFCFKCGKEDHMPSTCDQLQKWVDKEASDSENFTWLRANTKPCPKCKTNIEKNQGCNHMHCSNCKHDFCWLCLTEWKKHGSVTGGYYACNLYDKMKNSEQGLVELEKGMNESRNELEVYGFHFERYKNHDKAGELMK